LLGDDVDSEGPQIRLIDWGLAHQHVLTDDGRPIAETLHSRCGSRSYMAPEVTNKEVSAITGYDGFQADVWSLGVCLFAIHLGFFPFEQAHIEHDWRARRVAASQMKGESTMATILDFYSQTDTVLSDALIALLDRMLVFDPKQRATLSEVMDSEWVNGWAAEACRSISCSSISSGSMQNTSATQLSRCSSESLSQLPNGALRPTVERQDSASTIHSASSHTSSHTSSVSGTHSMRDSIRAPARLQTQVEEEGEPTSHWAAVRYAIAGARQQIRQAQQQRRSNDELHNEPRFGRAQSFGKAFRSFGRTASLGKNPHRSPTIANESAAGF